MTFNVAFCCYAFAYYLDSAMVIQWNLLLKAFNVALKSKQFLGISVRTANLLLKMMEDKPKGSYTVG